MYRRDSNPRESRAGARFPATADLTAAKPPGRGRGFDALTWEKQKGHLQRMQVSFLVRVAGFEPTASWTRTKRDTKLRHTRIDYHIDYNIIRNHP